MLNLGQLTAMEGRMLDALTTLRAVVVKQTEGVLAQEEDGHEVAGREQGHEEVDEAPGSIEGHHGTNHHEDTSRHQTVDGHRRAALRHKPHVGLTVIVVADDRREGKEEDGDDNEGGTPGAYLRLEGRLGG